MLSVLCVGMHALIAHEVHKINRTKHEFNWYWIYVEFHGVNIFISVYMVAAGILTHFRQAALVVWWCKHMRTSIFKQETRQNGRDVNQKYIQFWLWLHLFRDTDLVAQCSCVVKSRVIKEKNVRQEECITGGLGSVVNSTALTSFIISNSHKNLNDSLPCIHLFHGSRIRFEAEWTENIHRSVETHMRTYDTTSNNETLSDCYKTKIFNRF